MPAGVRDLTVAVTGPTGTLGFGLMPLLQADNRVARIVGVARRPFDPAAYGWTKMVYYRGMSATSGPCRPRSAMPTRLCIWRSWLPAPRHVR